MRRGLAATISILAMMALGAGSASASLWTPVASGTTQDITALTYQSDAHAWYGTGGGQIFSADGAGVFQPVATFAGAAITKIAFDPTAAVGYAVSQNGHAYRSLDGGATWAAITLPPVIPTCGGTPPNVPVPALYSVALPNATTAYVTGGSTSTQPIVLKTINANAVTPAFTDVNYGTPDCKMASNGRYVTDVVAVPGAPNILYFINDYFGGIYQTTDGFASPMSLNGEPINNADATPRMAIDPNNPGRVWAVDHAGPSCGSLCFMSSSTGGATYTKMDIAGSPAGLQESLNGVGFAGGTLVAAGEGGEIYTSINGTQAFLQRADGALASTRWLAVGVSDATHAMIGGAGGTLVKSTIANSTPDTTAPTGLISGPSTATVGTAATFTAVVADEAGGSGIDPASLAWTATGLPGQASATVVYTFPAPGTYTLTVAFKDHAGNAATASKSIVVTKAVTTTSGNPPVKTTTVTDPSGAKLSLGVPKTCVKAGSTFKVTLSFKKIKKKGATFIKVFRTDFYIGTKVVNKDTKAPFSDRLKVKVGSKSGSTVTVRARAFMKVRHPKHGKYPTKSIRVTVKVC